MEARNAPGFNRCVCVFHIASSAGGCNGPSSFLFDGAGLPQNWDAARFLAAGRAARLGSYWQRMEAIDKRDLAAGDIGRRAAADRFSKGP